MKSEMHLLLIDRSTPTSEDILRRLLGREHANDALASGAERYMLICTVPTGGIPRYAHIVEFIASPEILERRLMAHIDAVEAWPVIPCVAVDIGYSLDPSLRDHLNGALDRHQIEQLRYAPARGAA